jgi:hypothetical protein
MLVMIKCMGCWIEWSESDMSLYVYKHACMEECMDGCIGIYK